MFDLTGKTALVTGATGGIGEAIATALHAQGATVALSGTRKAVLETLAAKLGDRTHVLPCNLSNAAEVEELVPSAEKAMGQLDILVSNAGIQIVKPIVDFPFADWKKLLSIHLDGAFLTTRACLKHMYAANYGRVIYMGSVHSKEASKLKAPYVTAKHGLIGLAKVVAKDCLLYTSPSPRD